MGCVVELYSPLNSPTYSSLYSPALVVVCFGNIFSNLCTMCLVVPWWSLVDELHQRALLRRSRYEGNGIGPCALDGVQVVHAFA